MSLKHWIIFVLLVFMLNNAAAFTIDQGSFRLNVYSQGSFSLAVKDPVSGTYYQIATGKGLDISRLNSSLVPSQPQGKPKCFISGVKLLKTEQAGAGAPCYKIASIEAQVTNKESSPQTVYILGFTLKMAGNSQTSVKEEYFWPCAGPIVLSTDSSGFNVIDQYEFPHSLDWSAGPKSFVARPSG
jgi:hypothetical protein